jgi:hypothetical protein
MSEYERINKYREDTKQYEIDESLMFRDEVERGEYPSKCIKCYKSGLRHCRFWLIDYCCEEVEEGEAFDLALKFVKRENRK